MTETLRRMGDARGLTLIEVLIAIAILMAIVVGVAQLIAVAARVNLQARQHASAVILAAAKLDELRSLAWTYDAPQPGMAPTPRSDRQTDISHPDRPASGVGLRASPAGTLSSNTPPYVEYLDVHGRWLGHDSNAPPGAVFVRRWAVSPLAADPSRTLVLQVLVTTTYAESVRTAPWTERSGVEALLVSVKTRSAQ